MTQALNDLSAAADGTVLGIDPNGNILQAVSGPTWQTLPLTNITGKVANVGVATDGTIMAVSTAGLWQYDATAKNWSPITCKYPLEEISVGSAENIWGCDGRGNVYQYSASSGFTSQSDDIWLVSAAADGAVWAIDGASTPRQWDSKNSTWLMPTPPDDSMGAGCDRTSNHIPIRQCWL